MLRDAKLSNHAKENVFCRISTMIHDSGNFNICCFLRWCFFLKFFPLGVCHPFALLCCVVGAAMSSLRLSSCSPRKNSKTSWRTEFDLEKLYHHDFLANEP